MVEYQNFNASYILWEMVAVNVTALTFSVFYRWFTGHLHLFISICAPIRTEEPEKKKKYSYQQIRMFTELIVSYL